MQERPSNPPRGSLHMCLLLSPVLCAGLVHASEDDQVRQRLQERRTGHELQQSVQQDLTVRWRDFSCVIGLQRPSIDRPFFHSLTTFHDASLLSLELQRDTPWSCRSCDRRFPDIGLIVQTRMEPPCRGQWHESVYDRRLFSTACRRYLLTTISEQRANPGNAPDAVVSDTLIVFTGRVHYSIVHCSWSRQCQMKTEHAWRLFRSFGKIQPTYEAEFPPTDHVHTFLVVALCGLPRPRYRSFCWLSTRR